MATRALWLLCAVWSVPTAALADAPKVAPAPSAQVGTTTSVLPAAEAPRRYVVQGGVEYRGLLVWDDSRANDHGLFYFAQGEYHFDAGLTAFARMGVSQPFSIREGAAPFSLQDTVLGASQSWTLRLGEALSREVHLLGVASLFLPTSLESWREPLYCAPDVRLQASTTLWGRVRVGADAKGQYRFYKYAEASNADSFGADPMNTRLVLQLRPFASAELWSFGRYGSLSASADLTRSWGLKYGARDDYAAPESDAQYWKHGWGWGAALSYQPVSALTASLSLSQNASVLRNGVVNVDPFHRDQTELGFGLSGRY